MTVILKGMCSGKLPSRMNRKKKIIRHTIDSFVIDSFVIDSFVIDSFVIDSFFLLILMLSIVYIKCATFN